MQLPSFPHRRAARPHAAALKRTIAADPRDATSETIVGRRDVAMVPWLTIAICTAALALGAVVRADGGPIDLFLFVGPLTMAIGASVMVWIQDRPLGLRFRGSLWPYVSATTYLGGATVVAAIHDQGLLTVSFGATVVIAAYAGLVFPSRWSRSFLVLLLGSTAGVQALRPIDDWVAVVTAFVMIVAGWLIGALSRSFHREATRRGQRLASTDSLTGMLSRRGLMAQLEWHLATTGGDPRLAFMIIDLDEFKTVNDDHGHAAGDDLLRWVGDTLAEVVPEGAEVGRLGGDEFAVILAGVDHRTALETARAFRLALEPRASASVGVATTQTRAIDLDDLVRVADAAVATCKTSSTVGVQALVAGSSGLSFPQPTREKRPPLTYAAVRARRAARKAGVRPESAQAGMIATGLGVIAIAGAAVVIAAWVTPQPGFWNDVIRLTGVVWVTCFVGLGVFLLRVRNMTWALIRRVSFLSNVGIGIGVGTAMLAHGGLTATLGTGLFLKVLFDASIAPARKLPSTVVIMPATLLAVAALSPASQLWALPYQLTLMVAAHLIGAIGFRAFADLNAVTFHRAHTDPLTLLLNRSRFERVAGRLLDGAKEAGTGFGLLVVDLDAMRAYNEAHGHAAGDELLRKVAEIAGATFPDSGAIGRSGGDEFLVAIEPRTEREAAAEAWSLTLALEEVIGVSVGYGVLGQDGDDLDAVTRAADRRSYAAKRARRAHAAEIEGFRVNAA